MHHIPVKISDAGEEGPDAALLQSVLCYLMTRYTLRPSSTLANSIVEHLRLYLAHPEVTSLPGRCSTYRSLLEQWEAIAIRQMPEASSLPAQSKALH
jgi:hypothetical protein